MIYAPTIPIFTLSPLRRLPVRSRFLVRPQLLAYT